MTKEEFNRVSADTVFVFTAHLKDNALGRNAADGAMTLKVLANSWIAAQPMAVQQGIIAIGGTGIDAGGHGSLEILGEKGAVEKLFRAFADTLTHMDFASYTPPAPPQARTTVPGIVRKR